MTARILVLYTGGTFGMVPSARGYVPAADLDTRIRAALGPRTRALPEYDLLELTPPIDSANLLPHDWTRMAAALAAHWQDYDGFVLVHGTDTMAYTAAALSFMLRGLDKPVILTGAQIPLGQLRSDAADNLITALLLASRPEINEVCICFNGRLLRGNRARKVRACALDAFDSPNFPWLGEAGISVKLRHDLLLPAGEPAFVVPGFCNDAVVMIQAWPGMTAAVLAAMLSQPGTGGVVLQGYGVGNMPVTDDALLQVLADAVQDGKTVVNVSQCLSGMVCQGTYATGARLERIGVLPGLDLTPEAAFAKLHLLQALGMTPAQVRQAMTESWCGECTPPPQGSGG